MPKKVRLTCLCEFKLQALSSGWMNCSFLQELFLSHMYYSLTSLTLCSWTSRVCYCCVNTVLLFVQEPLQHPDDSALRIFCVYYIVAVNSACWNGSMGKFPCWISHHNSAGGYYRTTFTVTVFAVWQRETCYFLLYSLHTNDCSSCFLFVRWLTTQWGLMNMDEKNCLMQWSAISN